MEKAILNQLQFKLTCPTTLHFVKVYQILFKIPDNVLLTAQVKFRKIYEIIFIFISI